MVDSLGMFSEKGGETINLVELTSEEEEAEETLNSTEARVLFKTEGDYTITSGKDSNIEDVTPDVRTSSTMMSISCNTFTTASNLSDTDAEMEEVQPLSF